MHKHGWLLAAALAFVGTGCHKDSQASSDEASEEQAQAQAQEEEAAQQEAEPEPEKPIVVTNDMIDKYLAYQKQSLANYQEMMKDLKSYDAKADAGDYKGAFGTMAGIKDGMNLIQKQADAEEKARKSVGLSEREIDQVRGLVSDVIARRQLMMSMNLSEQVKQLEKMRDSLPADQRKDLQASIDSMKQQQKEVTELADARKEYGDASVEAVLSREKDLTESYQAWMKAFMGPGANGAPTK
jgi:hypothetical protein